MTFELIRDYLVSVGAHQDEIHAFAQLRNHEFQDLIWALVQGKCDPESPQFAPHRMEAIVHYLAYPGISRIGLSLVIERLVPGIARLDKGIRFKACARLIKFVDSHKRRAMFKALSITGSSLLVCYHRDKIQDDVHAPFLFDAIADAVIEMARSNHTVREDVVITNLLTETLDRCNELYFARAMIHGARQCKDGDLLLYEIGKTFYFEPHGRVCAILSCLYIYGLDSFETGWSGTGKVIPYIEEYISSIYLAVNVAIQNANVSRLVMEHFCKFK